MKPITFLVAATIIFVSLTVSACVQVECTEWNTPGFFQSAGVSDVIRCLQAGADPNARSEYGATPLHTAAMFGTVEVVGALLEVGADPNARSEDGTTPLLLAAMRNPALMDALEADVSDEGLFGFPMRRLAVSETADVVTALLAAGVDPNTRGPDGATPLHMAAAVRNADAVTALLEAGADPNTRSPRGTTPLHMVAKMWYPTQQGGAAEVIAVLIEAGADLEAREDSLGTGQTPLHSAAGFGTAETVTALLEAGANPTARNDNGQTPLHVAAEFGTAETVTALLESGVDPNVRNNDGELPVDHAEDNEQLRGTDAYWRLNDARFQ